MELFDKGKNKIAGIALFIILMLLLILKIVFKKP